MSSSTATSALAHIIDHKMTDIVNTQNINNNNNYIHQTSPSNDNMTSITDSADVDMTFNVVMAMILISSVTGNTLLAIMSTIFIIVILKITPPEVIDTETILTQQAATTDVTIPTAHITNLQTSTDDELSTLIVPVDETVRVYHHARPTSYIAEIITPATTSVEDIKSTNHGNDYFGGLASDIFNFKSFHEYLEEDQMWLAHMPHPNPAITSAPEATAIVQTTKIAKAARPASKTIPTSLKFRLSTIYEEDEEEIEEDEEDIEFPRSSSDEADDNHNSLADFEDFSDSEEEIIAFAKKVNRLCDELDKVERFSEPVEHIIALGQDIEATFKQWDEEDLEMFSDSEEDTISLAKQIEVDTRPSPPDSPVRAAKKSPRFTASGFLIETPENSPHAHSPIGPPLRSPEGRFLQTPNGIQVRKNIFASPIGESFQHTRKVSNETNTSEDTNGSKTTTTAPESPTTVYSSPDNVQEYQAMAGFTVALSAKKATAISFHPIAQPGDDIQYDRRFLKDETPSPSPTRYQSPASDRSTPSTKSEDMSTPYDFTHHSDDSEILAILKRPGGATYAKMSCGNWFFLNDDGTLDELSWREYEELIDFIVGDIASLPQKLHHESIGHVVQSQEEELPLPWVPWDDEPEILPEVNVEEELPLPWVPWDEPETVSSEAEPKLEGQHDKSTSETINNITEPVDEKITANVAEDIINSDQPDEKWYKAEEMPPRWFVMEHIRCPGDEISYYAEYVRGSDDRWYFRLDGPEYRPLDARELRWFLNWRASTRPLTYIVELEEEECF
ncbi:uncharacterized protein B0T23DRAFT_311307 [Neurospora hispaniola]|uniref:Uncharacterized protein n=1 Tax=Neurospora hispaniola TaxID=588809 RepID=A0AAJ0MUB4_9PEZI|nr:hypothetical protein B0T23DRAFT_311307 [Neurospora hispaniola]